MHQYYQFDPQLRVEFHELRGRVFAIWLGRGQEGLRAQFKMDTCTTLSAGARGLRHGWHGDYRTVISTR